eukprot:TRINITY_DN536_c0_g1_i1.p1 TRINITY_DN536_c0_g1~~TRINITY_DN536_c0_g1_i1.p1  ORF type:complete len:135 (-),score=14.58 TRINITY_DN536_c0_g1_i1:161-535(-)
MKTTWFVLCLSLVVCQGLKFECGDGSAPHCNCKDDPHGHPHRVLCKNGVLPDCKCEDGNLPRIKTPCANGKQPLCPGACADGSDAIMDGDMTTKPCKDGSRFKKRKCYCEDGSPFHGNNGRKLF